MSIGKSYLLRIRRLFSKVEGQGSGIPHLAKNERDVSNLDAVFKD
jgi:hypothetical protein